MPRGRKPKSAAQRHFEGNLKGHAIPTDEEQVHPDEAPAEPPDWLDDEARIEWDRVIVNLIAKNLVGRSDTAVLANYCRAVSTCVACYKDIDANGYVGVYSKTGAEFKRPILTVLNDARGAVIRYAAELGLTVVARTRLGNGRQVTAKKSKLEEFVNKGLKISQGNHNA